MVKYEIEQAWTQGKGLLGIYIHNLQDPRTGTTFKGMNPFSDYTTQINGQTINLASIVRCYDPLPYNTYSDIQANLATLVEDAIAYRQRSFGYRF